MSTLRTWSFVKQALMRPSEIGAIAPSSARLARAMAAHAAGADHVIELGAGTGAVTAALREKNPHVPLLAVELMQPLVQQLRSRFPEIHVTCDAAHLVLQEQQHCAPDHTVVVSSLPFRSLNEPIRSQTQEALLNFLQAHPSRRLVQFTYLLRAPFDLPANSPLSWQRHGAVWRNLPPAGVWVLQRKSA
jgi:phosphatidylethanolamine/phosphatidyl-N-methylethanolamine N-methyltransferase